jgi:hypothetical protein
VSAIVQKDLGAAAIRLRNCRLANGLKLLGYLLPKLVSSVATNLRCASILEQLINSEKEVSVATHNGFAPPDYTLEMIALYEVIPNLSNCDSLTIPKSVSLHRLRNGP